MIIIHCCCLSFQAMLAPSVGTQTLNIAGGNVYLNYAGQVVPVAVANVSTTVFPELVLTKRTKVSGPCQT